MQSTLHPQNFGLLLSFCVIQPGFVVDLLPFLVGCQDEMIKPTQHAHIFDPNAHTLKEWMRRFGVMVVVSSDFRSLRESAGYGDILVRLRKSPMLGDGILCSFVVATYSTPPAAGKNRKKGCAWGATHPMHTLFCGILLAKA